MKTVALFLSLIFLLGVALAQGQGPDELIQQSKDLFAANCADCHRLNGGGLPNKFPALNKNPYVLGDPGGVISTVLNGRQGNLGRMPSWKNKLDDQKIAAVVTYVRQAWANRAPAVTPAMVAAIRGQ
ncbi:MAG: cytochrome c [Desulfobaccales bacterium]|nr:cytochrome c [Desulfobaccales bacterium]